MTDHYCPKLHKTITRLNPPTLPHGSRQQGAPPLTKGNKRLTTLRCCLLFLGGRTSCKEYIFLGLIVSLVSFKCSSGCSLPWEKKGNTVQSSPAPRPQSFPQLQDSTKEEKTLGQQALPWNKAHTRSLASARRDLASMAGRWQGHQQATGG